MKTVGAFQEHELPNGEKVYYRDRDHAYFTAINGDKGVGRISSPSTIAKWCDPDPSKLMGWAGRKDVEGVAELLSGVTGETDADALLDALGWMTDSEQLYRALKDNKLTWRDRRDARGDEGTLAHKAFEDALRGIKTQAAGPAAPYIEAVNQFMDDHPSLIALNVEQVVYSKAHGYAGRFDARVSYQDDPEGPPEYWLLDLKTSRYIALAYHYQLALYEMAARECGVGETDKQFILQVGERGYRLIENVATPEDARQCLDLYRGSKEVGKLARAAERAAA